VHVIDRVTEGPKPRLVSDLGAHYHTGDVAELAAAADVVIECTGVGQIVFDIVSKTPPGCVTCLTGISSGGRPIPADFGVLNKAMVLENDVIFGSVNANRRHYEAAARALESADREWLGRIVNRRVSLEDWQDALTRRPDDVKPVIQIAGD
jgi:threonine dehydrogenase-like Zn-dependent dehydrogenase